MKSLWLKKSEVYDGTQLRPLRNYLEHGLLGDSIVAWKGPCHLSFEHMLDGEDLRDKSPIEGSMMLHFVVELFDQSLTAGVFFQRMMADHVRALIEERSGQKILLKRQGDDLYWQNRKLSISIASRSANSVLVHFAVNLSNQGTPVATCAIEEDFGLVAEPFAIDLMERVLLEWQSIREATWKVRTL